jgi:hypothetical protein
MTVSAALKNRYIPTDEGGLSKKNPRADARTPEAAA